jgi:Anti-sigma-K factor rskA
MPLRRRPRDEPAPDVAELAALADGSIGPEHRAALEAQVAASSELADQLAEQQRAVALAQSAAAEVEAPAGLRARIDAQRRPRPAPAMRGFALVGAAATAVAAVAIGSAVFGSDTSGERFHAALAPTGLAPGAGGEVTFTKTTSGWRIELDATGLPRLDGGRFYQAWLRSSDGELVPVGTFNESRDVTLWAGVSPIDFPTLTVTREEADGDQDSSGERVLIGTADTGG